MKAEKAYQFEDYLKIDFHGWMTIRILLCYLFNCYLIAPKRKMALWLLWGVWLEPYLHSICSVWTVPRGGGGAGERTGDRTSPEDLHLYIINE